MRIKTVLYEQGKVEPKELGYIELDTFNYHKCYALCNWKHLYQNKPKELHIEGDTHYSHGLCFINPETEEECLCRSFDWLCGSHEEITKYISENKDSLVLI